MLISEQQVQASIRPHRTGVSFRLNGKMLTEAVRKHTRTTVRVVKAADERRYVLGLAYGPNQLDGHHEFVDRQTVEDAAWNYLADGGRQIGLHHIDGTVGHARVVESYIYRGPDWEVTDAQGNSQTIRSGDWLLGAIFDEPAWRLVKSGRVTGWSIDGLGHRIEMSRAEAPITTTPGEGE